MDKLDHYRTCIQTLLERNSHNKTSDAEVESQLFFDTVCDHYQLMSVGWDDLDRIYHTVLHFDIKNGKIWLQQNTTDIDVGQELIDMGVPKQDIAVFINMEHTKNPETFIQQGLYMMP